MSADGRLVLTGPDAGREPRLYDARSGDRLDAWGPGWRVRAAAFAGPTRVTWLVEQDRRAGDLLTCDTARPATARALVELGEPEEVLLAGDSRR